jgi:hypothetical protein
MWGCFGSCKRGCFGSFKLKGVVLALSKGRAHKNINLLHVILSITFARRKIANRIASVSRLYCTVVARSYTKAASKLPTLHFLFM